MKICASLMLKAPRPGTVKTRLAAEIGEIRATEIYRTLVEHQLHQIPTAWRCSVHYAPVDAEGEMREWLDGLAPTGTRYHPQCSGDLGARMRHALIQDLAAGAEVAVLLGGDCPEITHDVLCSVGEHIFQNDMVVAPAADGGYALLALRQDCPELFTGIPWSSSEVLEKTLLKSKTHGLKVWITPRTFVDVDDGKSLQLVRERNTNQQDWSVAE